MEGEISPAHLAVGLLCSPPPGSPTFSLCLAGSPWVGTIFLCMGMKAMIFLFCFVFPVDYLQEGQGAEAVIGLNSISDLENPTAFIATSILL